MARTPDGSTDPTTRARTRGGGELIARGVRGWGLGLGGVIALGSLVFAAGVAADGGETLRIAATAFGLAATAGLVGGFTGMLFGMPREAERSADRGASNARYAFNSNLLKVSDWVTTIIVGLSLVSLRSVPGALADLADWLAPALGGDAASGPFGVFLAGAAFVAMFMLLYIWSSIPLRGHLENEALDAEQQWAAMLQQVAEQKAPEEISRSLQGVSADVLEKLQADGLRTPPLLRDLAMEEFTRRESSAG